MNQKKRERKTAGFKATNWRLLPPQRPSGHAVVTGRRRLLPPPRYKGSFIVCHAEGSAFPLLVDLHRILPTQALAHSAKEQHSRKKDKKQEKSRPVQSDLCTMYKIHQPRLERLTHSREQRLTSLPLTDPQPSSLTDPQPSTHLHPLHTGSKIQARTYRSAPAFQLNPYYSKQ